jgi:hypothetical protein
MGANGSFTSPIQTDTSLASRNSCPSAADPRFASRAADSHVESGDAGGFATRAPAFRCERCAGAADAELVAAGGARLAPSAFRRLGGRCAGAADERGAGAPRRRFAGPVFPAAEDAGRDGDRAVPRVRGPRAQVPVSGHGGVHFGIPQGHLADVQIEPDIKNAFVRRRQLTCKSRGNRVLLSPLLKTFRAGVRHHFKLALHRPFPP